MTAILTIAHSGATGRLRLSAPRLRGRADLAGRIAGAAERHPAILSASLRASTGSVVAAYDPAQATAEEVRAALEAGLLRRPAPPCAAARPCAAHSRPAPSSAPARALAPLRPSAALSKIPTAGETPWAAMTAEAVAARLGADLENGLTETEAALRRARFGPNVAPAQEPPSPWSLLARQFNGLPVAMLGVSAVISLGSGGVADAIATLSVVVVNGVLGFVTEGQAERRIHDLMGGAREKAVVIREGRRFEIRASELAPGDLIEVAAGRQAPADSRLICAGRLSADESALTGESLAVEKSAAALASADAPIGERPGMLHAGSIVAEGLGRALVVETGARTEAAKIQALASEIGGRPQAPVEAALEKLGSRLALASLAACGLFVGVGLLRGYALRAMLKDALALAVAAVPEGLPMVATATLSHGLRRMEKKGILIRQIGVVETLGAMGTICLDKTGTLTENRMAAIAAGAGARPVALDDAAALTPLAEIALLNNDGDPEAPRGGGVSPTERALLEFALSLGLAAPALRAGRPRIATVERAPGRPWMTTIHGGKTPLIAVKGAPEAVLARSSHLLENGARRKLTAQDRADILALNEKMASRPARVLAFAKWERARPGRWAKRDWEGYEPQDLTFLGLLAMVDPIRAGAKEFIAALHGAGIDTVLITGDQVATAAATASALNLSNGAPLKVIEAPELSAAPEPLMRRLAEEAHVFARVSSQQKQAIVKALQASGRVVAMTGDGVNDGPALNAADVGVAMGESGTDLARDVANVVIRDDQLGTLIEAIGQGRSIYRNIRRSLEFLITTNMSEIVVSIIEALHGPGELETPMELLWINLATDVLPGLGLAMADPDPDVMARPPRAAGEEVIPPEDMRRMAIDSAIIAGAALTSHFVGLARYGPGPQTRGMTFLSLSLGQLLYTLVCQSTDPRKLRPDRLFENRSLDLALLGSAGLAVAPFFIPPLRRLLGVAPLAPADAMVALAMAATPFASVLARRKVEISFAKEEAA